MSILGWGIVGEGPITRLPETGAECASQLPSIFDRILAALERQQENRRHPNFGTWAARALPLFSEYVFAVERAWRHDAVATLDAFCAWMDRRRLRRRFLELNHPPLYFESPSLVKLVRAHQHLIPPREPWLPEPTPAKRAPRRKKEVVTP